MFDFFKNLFSSKKVIVSERFVNKVEQTNNIIKFEIYKDKSEQFRFRIVSKANGKVMASSEAYKTKQACKKTINSLIFSTNFDSEIVEV